MSEHEDIRRRLEEIDRELARLRRGQLVVRKRDGQPWIFRIWKEEGRTCSEAVGEVGGGGHAAAEAEIVRRRDLSRERRMLGRQYD